MSNKKAVKKVKGNSKASIKENPTINHQIDGKVDSKPLPQTLAQFWGEQSATKYGTSDVNEYLTQLKSMTTADLWAHATSVGEIPSDNREKLIRRLMNVFQLHVNSFNRPTSHIANQKGNEVPEHIKKILSEGR